MKMSRSGSQLRLPTDITVRRHVRVSATLPSADAMAIATLCTAPPSRVWLGVTRGSFDVASVGLILRSAQPVESIVATASAPTKAEITSFASRRPKRSRCRRGWGFRRP
jgi:hypothetical protein